MYTIYAFSLLALVVFSVEARKENQCPYQTIREPMVIESPLFEDNLLPNYFRCWYNITAPHDKIVEVKFSTFSFPPIRTHEKLNSGPIEKECLATFLQATIKDKTLKFCGNELQSRRLLSPDNRMQLLFQALNVMGFDDKSFKGFRAEIRFLDEEEFSYCENTVIMAEEKITIDKMETDSHCSMAVKAPANKVPEVKLVKKKGGCEIDLEIDPRVAVTKSAESTEKQVSWGFNCDKPVTSVNKNVNLVPFKLSNEDAEAKFDIVFTYNDPTPVRACGGEIVMKTGSTPIQIDLGPGRYNCMWTYTTRGTQFDDKQLVPRIILDVVEMANATNGLCLTNSLAIVLENSSGSHPNYNNPPLICGQPISPMWSNAGLGKELKTAIIFSGTVPESGKALIVGEIQLE